MVSYVIDYSKEYYLNYIQRVIEELSKRNIKYNHKYYNEIFDFCDNDINYEYRQAQLIYPEHDKIYLRECLYNLEEKAIRGIISKEEWKVIYNQFKDFTELWEGE